MLVGDNDFVRVSNRRPRTLVPSPASTRLLPRGRGQPGHCQRRKLTRQAHHILAEAGEEAFRGGMTIIPAHRTG